MKAVIQRVYEASVSIDGTVHSQIERGLLVLIGIHKEDTDEDLAWMTRKIAQLRVFEDEAGQMNLPLAAVNGEILVVSQFTLIASNKKGNRPSFNDAADPGKGKDYCDRIVCDLRNATGRPVKTGVFAADMQVSLVNDGPVTITLDTHYKE